MPLDLIHELRTRRLLAVVRAESADDAVSLVDTLARAGVGLVEVSLTGPDALTAVERARTVARGALTLGAGTVLTAADVRRSADAGAEFIVTPGMCAAVNEAVSRGLPVLAGALTPSEIIAAMAAGATAIKLFPASLGGVAHLRALRAPFPHVPFVPVGGVDATAAGEYLAAGAVAVGVGGPLVGDPTLLVERIAQFRALVAA